MKLRSFCLVFFLFPLLLVGKEISFKHIEFPDQDLVSIEELKIQANKGFPLAQTQYAILLYKKGEEEWRTKEKIDFYMESAKWLKLAANQEEKIASYYLGYAYFKGTGVPKDFAKSVKWLEASASQLFVPAVRSLAYFFLDCVKERSFFWFSILQHLSPNEADTLYWLDFFDTEMSDELLKKGKQEAKAWLERQTQKEEES